MGEVAGGLRIAGRAADRTTRDRRALAPDRKRDFSAVQQRACTLPPDAITNLGASIVSGVDSVKYISAQQAAGLVHYIPRNLGELGDYYRRFIDPPDVMIIKACPMDVDGYFNLSASNLWHRDAAASAKVVIVEVCDTLPYVYGVGIGLHISEVDYVIQGDGRPVPELSNAAATDVDRAVAGLIAAEIENGACIQIGIGAMPNTVCSLLLESGVRDLGVHTEMLTDGIIDLYRAAW